MKITLLIIGLTIANVMLFWWIFVEQKHRNFERFLKVGDRVDYYVGENRQTYTLEKEYSDWVEIRNSFGHLKVRRVDLLPNLWTKYERITS